MKNGKKICASNLPLYGNTKILVQCSAHTGRQWLTPTTTPPLPTSTPRYPTTTHSTSIYRSSLSRYARVAIVYLARFFLRPMGHGSSHARSRSTQLRAMIKSSQNVHYIEQSNLWVGKAQGMCARARMRTAHYRVMYIIPRFSFASGTEAS